MAQVLLVQLENDSLSKLKDNMMSYSAQNMLYIFPKHFQIK